jgi:hypothetical protein
MSGPNVVWGMTGYGPLPYPAVYTSHMRAMGYAARHFATAFLDGSARIAGAGATDRMYTHAAENQIVRDFLAIPDATHLFLTELDMVLPDDTIPTLVRLGKPIASGLYFLRGGNGQPCLYVKTPMTPALNPYPHTPVSLFPTEAPFKLGRTGGCPGLGCVLIERRVFAAIEEPWFDLKERNPRTLEGYGSDMYFFTKVRDAGFEVWVEPAVRCGHMDYVEVTFADHRQRLATDPGYAARGFILAPDGAVGG